MSCLSMQRKYFRSSFQGLRLDYVISISLAIHESARSQTDACPLLN
jgi:hypothetical protein